MEPGLAVAAYTAETAIQGAAAAAIAIGQSTTPLKARFHRLPSPAAALKRSSHTLSVIKGRAYVFGGDGHAVGPQGENAIHVVTLPTGLDLGDTDYQNISAVAKPSKRVFDNGEDNKIHPSAQSESDGKAEDVPAARAGHCAAVIGNRIYMFGGSSPTGTSDSTTPPNPPLEEKGRVYAFDTVSKTWEVLIPSEQGCRDGAPLARNYASSSSTEHPLPIPVEGAIKPGQDELMTDEARLRLVTKREGKDIVATNEQQSEGYGTVFVHGGYDSDWNLLRDVWAFDVGSRIWSRWPDVPDADVEVGEGNICCVESRLWRCGDGFGKMAYFEIVLDRFNDMGGKGELGVSPKSGKWEVHSFGVKPGFENLEEKVERKMGSKPANAGSLYPVQRKRSGFVPVTTGQGREYLLFLMGETGPQDVRNDIWSFQIASEKKSAAAFKDTVRSILGRETGLEQWAQADVHESSRDDASQEFPKGLSRFGSSPGGDWGPGIVIWGGIGPDGDVSGDGWILTVE